MFLFSDIGVSFLFDDAPILICYEMEIFVQ